MESQKYLMPPINFGSIFEVWRVEKLDLNCLYFEVSKTWSKIFDLSFLRFEGLKIYLNLSVLWSMENIFWNFWVIWSMLSGVWASRSVLCAFGTVSIDFLSSGKSKICVFDYRNLCFELRIFELFDLSWFGPP